MKRLITLLSTALFSAASLAGTLNWTWTNPVLYEDNTSIAAGDITQTRSEYGTCNGAAFGTKLGEVITPGTATTANKPGLAAGTYCVQAYTTAKGKESAVSNVKSFLLDQSAPKPPVLVALTGTAALIPISTSYGWAMGDQVGTVKDGAECDSNVSFGNGMYALKDPKGDVKYYFMRRHRAVIAAQCA